MIQATFKLLQDGFNLKRALAFVDNHVTTVCVVLISIVIYTDYMYRLLAITQKEFQ